MLVGAAKESKHSQENDNDADDEDEEGGFIAF